MFKYLNRSIPALVLIGIIVVLAVVVGGGIFVYQYFMTEDRTFNQNKGVLSESEMIGFWQDSPSVGSGYSNYYLFFASGKFEWHISEMVCFNGTQSVSGDWNIENNKLVLSIKDAINGLNFNDCSPSAFPVEEYQIPESGEFSLSEIKYDKNKSPYNYIEINGKNFYQLSDNPLGDPEAMY